MNGIKKHEVVNDLLGYDGLKIIQRPDMFNFSLDSTLLADFALTPMKVKTIVDFGTGNGAIPLFLSLKTDAKMIGLEIQATVADMAKRSVQLNKLEHQITIIQADIKDVADYVKTNHVDLVTCNPPFFKYKAGANINESTFKTIARHEVAITLETIVSMARMVLNNKGRFVLVHRAERLEEVVTVLEKHRFALKRMRFVHPRHNKEANMVLIDAMKEGGKGLRIHPPLIVHENDGYSDEVNAIFRYGST